MSIISGISFLDLICFVLLFPLVGAIINGFLGKRLNKSIVGFIGCAAIGLSFIVAVLVLLDLLKLAPEHRVFEKDYFTWIGSGTFEALAGLQVDPLSVVMILVVTGVGFLIHVYSIGYMHEDESFYRYFTYLNLFTFSMLLLVLANNFLLMFIGWEGVGLCSYLLIGFWFEKKSASAAGKKAFIVNRVGDFGFILAILFIFVTFHTIDFTEVFHAAPEHLQTGSSIIVIITLLLFVGAVGKSAQIPLYTWLPDAMEGPTPVSALIHAATMVTAGVYMVVRCNVLYTLSPFSLSVVAVIGGATALFAATIGLAQNDIKRVLAYSTVSQIGYMFLACGLGAYITGVFHLITHAFFKALLFLGSGSVIHGLGGEQDMRKMGALKKYMPVTYITFFIGTLAIAGIPPFAGFFSKDEILLEAYTKGNLFLWGLGAFAALLTAFYMFRLLFMTFHGKSRMDSDVEAHVHESPKSILVPLIVLAILSVFGGFLGFPTLSAINNFLAPVIGDGHHGLAHGGEEHHPSFVLMFSMMGVSTGIAIVGIMLAFIMYISRPDLPGAIARNFKWMYKVIFNKYYVDEIYDETFVKPTIWFSRGLWKIVDVGMIDGFVNAVGRLVILKGEVLKLFQTGFVRNYAFSIMLGGIIIIVCSILFL
ncbi:NADH dehydrogenase I chainL [Candidatus Scalindua japonica]|uniref:NADH dehydrogenase I chainL n=1 Tax=Candidatus Scalindua japonica TaxID=1284222 RepID=A0A286TU36_9BACT|nr:NADH-quinone oxidoreductase subunit L [Candidatus Scalindua japonica]GAX59402.1 NADH dehydrogenase I chainL [Candidatus Scalindua japonica]